MWVRIPPLTFYLLLHKVNPFDSYCHQAKALPGQCVVKVAKDEGRYNGGTFIYRESSTPWLVCGPLFRRLNFRPQGLNKWRCNLGALCR